MRGWIMTAFALTAALFAAIGAFVLMGDVFALYGTRLVAHDHGPLEMRLTTGGDRVIKGLEFLDEENRSTSSSSAPRARPSASIRIRRPWPA